MTDVPEGFADLFDREFERLVRSLRAVDDGADDAVQEAFMRAFLRWKRVGTLDDPAGWVRRVAVNRLLNDRRSRRRRDVAVERLATRVPDDDPFARLEILDAVRRLPRRQGVAVALYYGADLSVDEVAETMNLASGTVKSHLHDGRERLRVLLEDPSRG